LTLLNNKVEQLRQDFSEKTKNAEVLKIDLEKTSETLKMARTLLDKLSEEKVRW
jgi:dynein heavy chain 2, cytosolic